MSGHATFIGKLFSEKELIRRESEKKIAVLEKIIKIQGEALEEMQVLHYVGKNNQAKMYTIACQALKEVQEIIGELK